MAKHPSWFAGYWITLIKNFAFNELNSVSEFLRRSKKKFWEACFQIKAGVQRFQTAGILHEDSLREPKRTEVETCSSELGKNTQRHSICQLAHIWIMTHLCRCTGVVYSRNGVKCKSTGNRPCCFTPLHCITNLWLYSIYSCLIVSLRL